MHYHTHAIRTLAPGLVFLLSFLLLAACSINEDYQYEERYIVYLVDREEHREVTVDDEQWSALLDRFLTIAEEGHTLCFYNEYRPREVRHATKKKDTYETTDRNAMKEWMKQKEKEGKTVTITYDKKTGTYHGMAYAGAPTSVAYSPVYVGWADGPTRLYLSLDTVSQQLYCTASRQVRRPAGGIGAGVYCYTVDDNAGSLRVQMPSHGSLPWQSTVALTLGDGLMARTGGNTAALAAPLQFEPVSGVITFVCLEEEGVVHLFGHEEGCLVMQTSAGSLFADGECTMKTAPDGSGALYYADRTVDGITLQGNPITDETFVVEHLQTRLTFVRR